MKKKNIILLILVLIAGILLAAGTYAYFIIAANVINGNYVDSTQCFDIEYSVRETSSSTDAICANTDIDGDGYVSIIDSQQLSSFINSGNTNSQYDVNSDSVVDYDDVTLINQCVNTIGGTLFQSSNALGGISGRYHLNINESCDVDAVGEIFLKVDDTTSTLLTQTVREHCENSVTKVTVPGYTTESECVAISGNEWVTTGTALKYSIYDANNQLLTAGHIPSSVIGGQMSLYDGFSVGHTEQTYILYIWLDGYLADNTYVLQSFGGSMYAEIMQVE